MHRRILGLLAVGAFAAMSLAAAGGAAVSASGATAEPASASAAAGGRVVFGQDQEPRILNGWIVGGDLFATTEVVVPVMDAGMRYNNRANLVPLLFDGQPRIIDQRPFTVRFRYKRQARWNDGRQITAADFRFTWQTNVNPQWNIVSRLGWEDIRTVRARGKTATVVFKRPYAAWKPLVGSGPLPQHALRGENFNQVWQNNLNNPKTGRPIASGPYILDSWTRGQQIRLVRNNRYWGRRARLSEMIYRQVPNTNTQFQALQAGELDMTRPQPQLQIADIKRDRRFRVQQGPEYGWEHLDFQQGEAGHPALRGNRQRYVRRAIAQGINRAQIAATVFREFYGRLPVLQNAIFKPFETGKYERHWHIYPFNQQRAINLLRANRCTGGPARPSGSNRDVYSCPGVGALRFRFTSNLGANALRALTFQIIQRQLLSIGIELVADSVPSLQPRLSNKTWQIFMFTWISTPTTPIGTQANIHGCGGDQNYMDYCNRTVTRLLQQVTRTTSETRQIRLLNRADRLMAQDVVTYPLFARPGFVIHRRNIAGVLRNPTTASVFWNAGNWTIR